MTPVPNPSLCRQAIPDGPLLVLVARLPGTAFFQEIQTLIEFVQISLNKPQFRTVLFKKLGIESLHFKSTGYLFATQ